MKATTMTQIRTNVLELLDTESGTRYPDALLNTTINLGRDRLMGLLAKAGDEDWLTYCVGVEVATTNNRCSIPLPSQASSAALWWLAPIDTDNGGYFSPNTGTADELSVAPGVFRLRNVVIPESYTPTAGPGGDLSAVAQWGGKSRGCRRMGIQEVADDVTPREFTYSRPPGYRLIGGNTIYFAPRPSNTFCVFIWYTANLLDLGTSETVGMQPLWLEYLQKYTVSEMLRRDKDADGMQYAQEYMAIGEEIVADAHGRDEHEADAVRETWDADAYGDQDMRDRLTVDRWRR